MSPRRIEQLTVGWLNCSWEPNLYQFVLFGFRILTLNLVFCWLLGQDSNLEPFG